MLKAHITFGFNSGSTTNIGQYSFLLSKPDLKEKTWNGYQVVVLNRIKYILLVHFLGYSTW